MSPQYQSFYNIFDYLNFMHEAINGGLTYEMITITKTIECASGTLVAGKRYDTVYFLWKEQVFRFINWVPDPDKPYQDNPDPATLLEIPQSELASHCHWRSSETFAT